VFPQNEAIEVRRPTIQFDIQRDISPQLVSLDKYFITSSLDKNVIESEAQSSFFSGQVGLLSFWAPSRCVLIYQRNIRLTQENCLILLC